MIDYQKFAGLPMRALILMLRHVDAKESNDVCWEWRGNVNDFGYGRTKLLGKTALVHRVMFQIFAGETIPDGLVVRHTCDNPRCCNPSHLEVGTHADNVADRVARKRSAIGSQNGRAKLTEDDARAIFRDKRVSSEIAMEYGVDPSVVRQIKTRHTWRRATADLARATNVLPDETAGR